MPRPKATAAKRFIKTLEFFDLQGRPGSVSEIARFHDWPQSSTSELLAVMVEEGMLYYETPSRRYHPTPRAAFLATRSQPAALRSGALASLIDQLASETGLGVALVGRVGVQAQLLRWVHGGLLGPDDLPLIVASKMRTPLHACVAGWLLVSTLADDARQLLLRRLNADAPALSRFEVADLARRIDTIRTAGYAAGPAGFGSEAVMCGVLLPASYGAWPMVVGFIYKRSQDVDPARLAGLLKRSLRTSREAEAPSAPRDQGDEAVGSRPSTSEDVVLGMAAE
jgi:DNA-binding IclR family transcriptional regulator